MTRAEFLREQHVIGFIKWIVHSSGDLFPLGYYHRGRRTEMTFHSFEDAFSQYCWNCEDFEGRTVRLSDYRNRLNSALQAAQPHQVRQVVEETLQWGRVTNRYTLQYVESVEFFQEMAEMRDMLSDDRLLLQYHKCNASLSKVYAVLIDDLIIYDSRVAAFLGYLLREYLSQEHPDVTSLPEVLTIYLPPARGEYASRRNPSRNPIRFPNIWGSNEQAWERFAISKKKASWLVSALASHEGFPLSTSDEIEAAMFTLGYDVSYQADQDQVG